MRITPYKTRKITANSGSLESVLDESLPEFADGSVLAVTSKIVALCEGRAVSSEGVDKDSLVRAEADLIAQVESRYGFRYTLTNHTLIPSAGIDESNSNGQYILWPADAQATANRLRSYLQERFGVARAGVIITDSTSFPFRQGVIGIALAHSGFAALNNYIGQPDLFGRPFHVSRANVSGGLAAAAVLAMGEGTEQTPLCVLSDLPLVQFQPRNPTPEELDYLHIELEDDLFSPFFSAVPWSEGESKKAK